MDSGFYAACAGLQAQSQALEVAAHNLANLNTVGFRGQQPTFQTLLAAARPTVPNILNLATNNFGVLEGTHLDMTAGNLETTGNPLDVAIEGSGFFAIQTSAGTRYTRNGSFQVSTGGQLVTARRRSRARRSCAQGERRHQCSGGKRLHRFGWNALGEWRGRRQYPVGRVRCRNQAYLRGWKPARRSTGQRPSIAGVDGQAGRARIVECKSHQFGGSAARSAARGGNVAARHVAV